MEILYTDDPVLDLSNIPQLPSLFLAGPSPRSIAVQSWRPHALNLLKSKKFEGRVWVPEWKDPKNHVNFDFITQVDWEKAGLISSTVVLFWVPRNMTDMPALTTNIEFGRYIGMRPCVYGRPDSAPHNAYLDWMYQDLTGRNPCKTLEETIDEALKVIYPISAGIPVKLK